MADDPLHYQSIAALGRSIRAGKLSPVELTEHLLARTEALDGKLNAYRQPARERRDRGHSLENRSVGGVYGGRRGNDRRDQHRQGEPLQI